MTTDAQFWTKASRKYAASPIRDVDSYEYTLGRTRSYLSGTDRVIELGCGTGSTALLLAENVETYVGTDLSDGMIEIAREKAWDASMENLSFEVGNTEDILAKSEPQTRILAFNLLHLLRDVPATLNAVHGALEPGGLFISKSVCMGSAHLGYKALMRLIIPLMQMIGKAPFVQSMTTQALDKMIEDAGFEILEVGNHPVSPPSRYVVARKL